MADQSITGLEDAPAPLVGDWYLPIAQQGLRSRRILHTALMGATSWAALTGTPTTLVGYGITDALLAASYTAADVLAKLLTVDGAGSAVDADLLDGQQGAFYLPAASYAAANPAGTIGLAAVNGSAVTFLRSDGAPALSQAIAPTWTGLHTFDPVGGISITGGAPNISYGFAGHTAKVAQKTILTAASNTAPEFAGSFEITSSTGFANDLNAFKIPLTSVASGLAGTSSMWAANFVTTLGSGVGAVFGIGLEIDINIQNRQYITNGAPYATPLYITGTQTGTNRAQAGIILAYGAGGGNALFQWGQLFVDYGAHRLVAVAAISDQSRSPSILHSDTAHTHGVNFATATFSGNAFISPGFALDGAGIVTSGTWNGGVVVGQYGGTGVNNSGKTITLGGSLLTSGAFDTAITVTGATNITLPTTGTLVNSEVATLSSLVSIGTITTGVWNAGAVTSSGAGLFAGAVVAGASAAIGAELLRFRQAADQNIQFRGPINQADGTSLTSVNDAGAVVQDLELIAATVFLNAAIKTPLGTFSVGANDSGGAGFKLLRVPN